ncbi:MAG: DUF1987 domain-containing protein [Cyclobacteriaceae bacterium]|nr:DUF1987 domain-containing protein [Cyclobacteriaceae bacterium]
MDNYTSTSTIDNGVQLGAKKIEIEPSQSTPKVILDYQQKVLTIRGRSSPESTQNFYSRVYEMLDDYFQTQSTELTFNMELVYFNTSSGKCLFDVFRQLSSRKDNMTIHVNWHYEEDDDDMLETGEDFADASGLPFKFVTL